MSLNDVSSSNRIHISFFGCRNAGKSSLVNALTNQDLAVVSSVKGTTTDPVYKSMELLPLGPVVICDTPGLDDTGELGEKRVKKTRQVLRRTDIAILVVDGTVGLNEHDQEILNIIEEMNLPHLVVYNKCDQKSCDGFCVSAKERINIEALKEEIGKLKPEEKNILLADLLHPEDVVVLVIPIDESAPKGRLILPQQMVCRDILDAHAISVVCQDDELEQTLKIVKPNLVITDSQRFERVSKIVPEDIPLTSFSILMARYKGNLENAVQGAYTLDHLKDGEKILISEGCTHHRQCGDIGTVKLPHWIDSYTGKKLEYEFTQGREFPDDVTSYSLIIHCGGCMLNEKEMQYRMHYAQNHEVPMTNYGTAIAHMNGILKRSLEILNI